MLEPLAENDPPRVGPFAIEGRLGTSGHVYLGRDAVGVAAAVTLVRVEQAVDPRFRQRFAAEVTAAGRVRHRHVAALIDAHADADHPWLATEYVDGPLLREVVTERGSLPLAEVLRVTAGVAGALGAIREAGLVHGSLSADAVRLTPEGPRVIGLGVGEHAGETADVVALGALVTFLAGAEDELPEPLRALVVRCRATDPADRPTPAQFAAAAIAGETLAYETASPPENPLDLSAGIPSDAIVGPIPADAEPETAADPLAYAPAAPPENPLDLSAGIPGDAIVGPISADATTEEPSMRPTYAAAAPPAYPVDLSAGIARDAVVGPVDAAAPGEPSTSPTYAAAAPPANPIDLSAGIAGDAIVGPVDVTGGAAVEDEPGESLAYAATAPPANPVDLSAGIAGDAVVGPVEATAGPTAEPSEPLADAVAVAPAEASVEPGGGVAVVDAPAGTDVVTAPPIDPHDLAALRAAADAIEAEVAPVAGAWPSGDAARVIVPVAYGKPGKEKSRAGRPREPGRPPNPRRRRLVGAVVAVLLAAAVVTVPLLQDNTTDGTPVPALESVTPAAGDDPTTSRPACSGARTITASGSSLQHDAMLTIAEQWTGRCAGSTLDYSPDGTPGGVAQFAAGEADFAVVDHVLGENQGEIAGAAARCSGTGAPADKNLVLQLPMVLTPVAVTYHLPGVAELQLDAPALTAIFSGRLTRWNDRAVAELNPGVRLPATAVTVVARADEAQSTQTFQQFLTATGGWRSGSGPEFGGRARLPQQSDADVLAAVRSVEGAIGYLPYPLARAAQEPVVMITTGDGKGTAPDADAVHAAVDIAMHDTADLTALPGAIYRAGADQVGDGTPPYPLVHVGYVVACTQYPDRGATASIRDFLLTALDTQVQSVDGYQLPFGDLRLVLVDLVERTY